MEGRHPFSGIMLQLSIAGIGCMLYNIPTWKSEKIPVFLYVLLFAYGLISWSLNAAFLRKERTIGTAVLFNTLQICAGWTAAFLLRQITGLPSGIFIGIILFLLSLISFKTIAGGIRLNWLMLCFDVSAVLVLICSLFIGMGNGQGSGLIPGFFGAAAAFAGLAAARTGGQIPGRDRLMIVLLVFLIILAAFLICSLAGGVLGAGAAGAISGIGAFFRLLWDLIRRFFQYLSRFFKQEISEVSEMDMGPGFSLEGAQGGEEAQFSIIPLLVLAGILVLAGVIVFTALFRRHRISGDRKTRAVRRQAVVSDRVSLLKALRIWFGKIRRHLEIRFYFIKNRNTPAGRFFRLVRSAGRSGHALVKGETPREFLERYIESLKPEDKRIPELKKLTTELELQLYR